MATINKSSFSTAQWKAYIIPETAPGTAIVTGNHQLNVDKPVTVVEAPFIVDEVRTTDGRTIKAADWHVQDQGQIKTITISGIADKTTFPILAENCIGVAEATGTINVVYNYAVAGFDMTDSVLSGNIYTLTFALASPIANKVRVYPGCVVSELNFVDDVTAEGGRRRFTATLISRVPVSVDQVDIITPANSDALYTTYYSIWSYIGTAGLVYFDGDDVVLSKLDVTIQANPKINGIGLNGEGQNVNRAIPIIDIFGSVDIKWDANTQPLFQRLESGATVAMHIADNATIASATIGFKADYCKVPSDVNIIDQDGEAFITVPFRCTGSTSGSIAQIPV